MNDRCRGTLIGLAVGDALGAAVEFRSPGSFVPVTGYRGEAVAMNINSGGTVTLHCRWRRC